MADYNIWSAGPPINAGPGDDKRWMNRNRASERDLIAYNERQWQRQRALEGLQPYLLQQSPSEQYAPPVVAAEVVPEGPRRRELDLDPAGEIATPRVVVREIEL